MAIMKPSSAIETNTVNPEERVFIDDPSEG